MLFFGIKGFEPLNIRTKNEGLTNLAIFHNKIKNNFKLLLSLKKGWDSNPRYNKNYTKI
jgi:hypothetical protein